MRTEERFYCCYDFKPVIWLEDSREYCCNDCGTLMRSELLSEGEMFRVTRELEKLEDRNGKR